MCCLDLHNIIHIAPATVFAAGAGVNAIRGVSGGLFLLAYDFLQAQFVTSRRYLPYGEKPKSKASTAGGSGVR